MLLCGSRCSALARLERDQWLRRASEHPSHMLRGKWDRNILSLRKGKAEPPLPWAPPTSCSGCPEREEEEPLSPGTSSLAGNGGKSTAFPQTESLRWLFHLIFSPFDIDAYKHRQPEASSFPSAPLDLQGMPAEQRFFPSRKCSAEQLRCRRGLQNIPLPLPEASCCAASGASGCGDGAAHPRDVQLESSGPFISLLKGKSSGPPSLPNLWNKKKQPS